MGEGPHGILGNEATDGTEDTHRERGLKGREGSGGGRVFHKPNFYYHNR